MASIKSTKKVLFSLLAAVMAAGMLAGPVAKADRGGDRGDRDLRIRIKSDIDGDMLGNHLFGLGAGLGTLGLGSLGHGFISPLSTLGLGGFGGISPISSFGLGGLGLNDRTVTTNRVVQENTASIPTGFSIQRMPVLGNVL